jgi:5-methylcytosine-specific restriction endonuclease McrA
MPQRPVTLKPLKVRQSPLAQAAPRLRGTTTERGYDEAWKRLRADHLKREPLCRECRKAGRAVPATVGDHIIDIAERPDLRLEDDNIQSLCKTHHDRKTAAAQADRRRRQGGGGRSWMHRMGGPRG